MNYADYQQRIGATANADLPQAGVDIDPRLAGELVYVRATVKGFKRSSVSLRWSAYDARTNERLNTPALSQVSDVERTLDTPTDAFVQPIWIYPLDCTNRRYFVRVELLDSDHLLLAIADSQVFSGLRPNVDRPADVTAVCGR